MFVRSQEHVAFYDRRSSNTKDEYGVIEAVSPALEYGKTKSGLLFPGETAG